MKTLGRSCQHNEDTREELSAHTLGRSCQHNEDTREELSAQ